MIEVDTLMVAALNAAPRGIGEIGWQDLMRALAFWTDRSQDDQTPSFAAQDDGARGDLRAWLEMRPKGTQACLVLATPVNATGLPLQIEAGFKGGGLAAGTIVLEPKRIYGLAHRSTTGPIYQTTGASLYAFIAESPLTAAYRKALREELKLGSDGEVQRHFEAATGGAPLSDLVRVFRVVAKNVDTADKAWVRFLSKIPYGDHTQVVFSVESIDDAPSPDLNLAAARTELKAALVAAQALVAGQDEFQNWQGFFVHALGLFDKAPQLPREIHRISRHQHGPSTAPTAEAILEDFGLPKEALHLIGIAREIESIYGGMGSWNDTPFAGNASSSRLYRAAHLAHRVAVNQAARA